MALTERVIRDAKPGSTTRILWDCDVKGFGARITPAGSKAFILNYRVDGRERRATLARCSEISLREARERAGRELAAIRNGEADPLERRRKSREAPTVADGVQRFLGEVVPERIALGRMATRTAADYAQQCKRVILPTLGRVRVADVQRTDVERMVATLAPVSRNRVLALTSRLFRLFETWEWTPQQSNPVRGVERSREEPRDRVLADAEIEALGRALDQIDDNPFPVAAIRFLMLTGWRSGEVLALRWGHADLQSGRLTLPSTKSGRDVRTVGALVLRLLHEVPRVSGNEYIFAGVRGAPIAAKTLRTCFARACQRAGLTNVRPHDIRRTVATRAASAGLSVLLLRDLLNHKTVTMAARYARRGGSALQEAQNASAERMAALLAGKAGEVVPMERHRG